MSLCVACITLLLQHCTTGLIQTQLPAQVFEALWGTNELLSSFDSINILKPGQHESSTDGWLHVDQAPLRKGIACIQGLINMVDVGPDTGQQVCTQTFVSTPPCHIAIICSLCF